MTRKTIFRLTLALLLLPNFAAYWWMLPRRFKRCRTYRDAFMQTAMRHSQEFVRRQWERTFEAALRIEAARIAKREFRIPFQVQK